MIQNYIVGAMLVLSFVSCQAMDRIVVIPDGVRSGDTVCVTKHQEIVPYLRLAKTPGVHDFVVIMESHASHEQPVWAQVIAVNKVLRGGPQFHAVILYMVLQKQRASGLQIRREVPTDNLYALVTRSVFDYCGAPHDKANENMMDFHCEGSAR